MLSTFSATAAERQSLCVCVCKSVLGVISGMKHPTVTMGLKLCV